MDSKTANDYRRRTFGRDAERVVAYVCECADEDCRRAVLLTRGQFDHARAAGEAVVVDDSHLPAPGDAG